MKGLEKSIEDSTWKQSSKNMDVTCFSKAPSTNFMTVEKCLFAWMFTLGNKKKRENSR